MMCFTSVSELVAPETLMVYRANKYAKFELIANYTSSFPRLDRKCNTTECLSRPIEPRVTSEGDLGFLLSKNPLVFWKDLKGAIFGENFSIKVVIRTLKLYKFFNLPIHSQESGSFVIDHTHFIISHCKTIYIRQKIKSFLTALGLVTDEVGNERVFIYPFKKFSCILCNLTLMSDFPYRLIAR